MTYHDLLSTAGAIFALLMFVPMFLRVQRDGGVGQSMASWLLWGLLDTILIVSLIEQHGNFWIVVGFAIGDFLIAGALAFQKRFAWGKFESVVLFLVVMCMVGWQISGPRLATVFAIVAVCIAGVPGFVSLKKSPDQQTANIWFGYSMANLLSFFGGTAMTLEQRLAPGVFTLASLLMAWAGWRKKAD